jgi:hypothetical protein
VLQKCFTPEFSSLANDHIVNQKQLPATPTWMIYFVDILSTVIAYDEWQDSINNGTYKPEDEMQWDFIIYTTAFYEILVQDNRTNPHEEHYGSEKDDAMNRKSDGS